MNKSLLFLAAAIGSKINLLLTTLALMGILGLLPQLSFAVQADLPPRYEQVTPYNSLGSLVLKSRKGREVSAYILRKLLGDGNGVPNASRIAF